MELSRIAQALVAAPEAKELTTTESLPAPVLMEELLSIPTESALPPPHHQPLLVALELMVITSFPAPVWILVLLMPVVLLLFGPQSVLLVDAEMSMRVPKSLVDIKDVSLRAVLDARGPLAWLWIFAYCPVKVTDELLSAVAELESFRLHEFEKILSLSLVIDRLLLSTAFTSEE